MKENSQKNTRKGGCLFSLIKLFILVIVVLGVALYFCLGYVGDYALKTITSGTEITAGIGDIKVKPIDESVEVSNFYITNPTKKYNKEIALAFKRAFIEVDITPTDLLAKKLVVVDEISIDGLEVNIEYSDNSITSTNLNDIATIIENKVGLNKKDKTAKAETSQTSEPAQESEPMKFIIKKLSFKNGKASSSVLGNVAETILPDFEIENIGVEQGGKTVGEIIAHILPRIATQATSQLLKGGWKASVKLSDEAAKDIEKVSKDAIKQIKKLFE